jgi:hypothetical protein
MADITRKPRKLKAPQPCRYCGHVCDTHVREGRGGAAASRVSYSCRDAAKCGERLRGGKPIEQQADGIPF